MHSITIVLKGIVIGIANAIPGVSGGTMAVILKIYDKLLSVMSLSPAKLKKNWKFILLIGVGMALGVIAAAKLLSFFLEGYAGPTQLFFTGIILGSIPMIASEIAPKKSDWRSAVTVKNVITFLVGLALVVLSSVLVNAANDSASSGITMVNPATSILTVPHGIFILVVMFIAAVAMLLPGVSGSFVLLLLGGYQTVINAVNEITSPTPSTYGILICAAIGAGIGLLAGAKGISTLLQKNRQLTYCGILGLIFGSLYAIFPRGAIPPLQIIVGIVLAVFGMALPTLMEMLGKRLNSAK